MKLQAASPLVLAAALALAAGCTTSTRSATRTTPERPSTSSAPSVSTSPSTGGGASASALTDGAMTPQQVVKLVTPSVVRVQATGSAPSGVFGGSGRSQQQQGTGTGVIIDSQGHILTNNHVVTLESNNVATDLHVALSDGRNLPAKVVGRDPNTDLAVLQVDAQNLTPVKFAAAGSEEVGEPVLAIGYALNLQGTPTVTSGVISALDRLLPEATTSISGAIQTDAPINPGNSGGPLLDLGGQVVGINTAGQGGGTQGIFFAISADVAQPVIRDLVSKGKIDRGFIGIQTHSTTQDEAQSQKLPVASGASIDGVQQGTPAEKAGLRSGDIIIKIGNHDIHNTGDLQQALIDSPPGAKVTVTYYHGSDKKTADITLGTRPDNGS
jgi:serine protease Do